MFYLFLLSFVFFVSGQPLVQQALHVSQASYCDNITSWDCQTCDTDAILHKMVEYDGERSILGVYPEHDVIFVAFRGSTNIQNWIDNVQFALTCPFDNQTFCVETGFYKVFEYMYNDVTMTLANIVQHYDINHILVTGHSLGAAVASLTAYALYQDYPEYLVSLISFGSPRVGNEAFVEDFMKKKSVQISMRITHAYDIVPHVPQEFLGYIHIPHERWYPDDSIDQYVECNDTEHQEDSECSDSCGPFHCTSVQDHLYYLNITMGSTGDC